LKWRPELIMCGLEMLCMKMEHITFLDSVCFLPFPLRKLPEEFGLSSSKSWYPHYFNTEENLDYVGPMLDVSCYGADERCDSERKDFLAWYKDQKSSAAVFDNRRVLEEYCQADVTVLRQAYQSLGESLSRLGK
jgi:hypothetical protein